VELLTSIPATENQQCEKVALNSSGNKESDRILLDLSECGRLVFLDPGCSSENVPSSADKGPKDVIGVIGPVPLPALVDGRKRLFDWYVFSRLEKNRKKIPKPDHNSVNSVLIFGNIQEPNVLPLVRLHSGCHTGDVLGSMRCDCGAQLHEALRRMVESKLAIMMYLANQEGRGIGLWAKAIAYVVQDKGYDTYKANELLGFPADRRDYSDAVVVLRYLLKSRSKDIKLLSNNPEKKRVLELNGFNVVEMVELVAGINHFNLDYLKAKALRGHTLGKLDHSEQ
jgi:GTP cyclohydrolase II